MHYFLFTIYFQLCWALYCICRASEACLAYLQIRWPACIQSPLLEHSTLTSRFWNVPNYSLFTIFGQFEQMRFLNTEPLQFDQEFTRTKLIPIWKSVLNAESHKIFSFNEIFGSWVIFCTKYFKDDFFWSLPTLSFLSLLRETWKKLSSQSQGSPPPTHTHSHPVHMIMCLSVYSIKHLDKYLGVGGEQKRLVDHSHISKFSTF